MKHTFSIAFGLALRYVSRNKKRSLITFLAMTIGVASSVMLSSIARGVSSQIVKDAIYQLTGHVQIYAPGYRDDPSIDHRFQSKDFNSSLGELQQLVNETTERIRVPGVIVSERESLPVTIVGIDPEQETFTLAGQQVAGGENLSSKKDPGIIVGRKALEDLSTKLNRRVVLMTQGSDHQIVDRGFVIKGVFQAELETTEKGMIFVGRDVLAELLGVPGEVTEVSLTLKKDLPPAQLLEELKSSHPTLQVLSWQESEPMLVALTKLQSGFLLIWFSIVVVAISLGLMNTIFMGLYERMRELELLKALGTPSQVVFLQIMLESFLLLLSGALVGTLIGLSGTWYLMERGIDLSSFSQGASLAGIRSFIYPTIFWNDLLAMNLLLLILGSLAACYPAWFGSRNQKLPAPA